MRKRALLVLIGLAVVSAIGVVCLWLTRPGAGINRHTFDRIALGMTEKDIVALLRLPPGDYILGKPHVLVQEMSNSRKRSIPIDDFRRQEWDQRAKVWLSEEGIIVVRFGANGRSDNLCYFEVVRQRESIWQVIQRWIGL